jgi:hypothetical protein
MRRCSRLVVVLLLVASALLLAERWRGQWRLGSWKRQMRAKGEIFDAKRLWPSPSPAGVVFSNQFAQAIRQLPPGFWKYAGALSGIVQEDTGKFRRGSQEPLPPMTQKRPTNTWQDLDTLTRQAQPSLALLREIMKTPPRAGGYDIVDVLENHSFPNYANVRRGAQSLHTAVIHDLHNGDLAGALENLTALSAFGRLHLDVPTVVSLMINMAISGLTTDACWDALQARGWTEPQLALLQRSFQQESLLPQMARAMEAERAQHLYNLNRFRSHSFETWIAWILPAFEPFGIKPSDAPAGAAMFWHQWIFHPLWSFAWADQEEFDYLRQVQLDLTALRQAPVHRSWFVLNQQLTDNLRNYRRPMAAWRFYLQLPLADGMYDLSNGSRAETPVYPYPDYSRAWRTAFQNLTLREMVIAVIAIKRYELREGKSPSSLAALVPDFLDATPCDMMDGQPLRYRLNPNGSFTLYSVGADAYDDGGDPAPEITTDARQVAACGFPIKGRDWVWPQNVAAAQPLPKTATVVR